ncbi:ABC transporter permease [Thalassospiraceae bacterium LMO-SO8]|nr:ABC transporter permease [Alphaproteobacteria bacterium LMO-S08]WND77042.1 ABC transporter permease [Thalassospiraceae bacterium LMO-SO8]|tara:strand:+ start:34 stop:1179 length:1146 start_codon:yes stop_codon:yes gene_type:complete
MREVLIWNKAKRLRVAGLIRKETRQVVRDPSSILVAAVLPLILIFLFGYGVTFDPRFFTIGLVVEQPTPEAGSFTAALSNSPYFRIQTARDRRSFEQDLVAGDLHGIVTLPASFAEQAYRGETAPIQVIVDGSDPNTADLVRNYIQLLWANWLEQESISRGPHLLPTAVELEPLVWFNPEISSRNYLVPGSVAIILTLIGALLTALVVAREWERGTMEALLATPIGIVELLVGKLVPYFLLGLGSMALSTATAVLLFGVPFRGSFLLLGLVSALFMWAALGQGLLISTVTRNQLVAAQASILSAFLPAFYFSNFVFEIDSMPWPLQLISYAVPARYFVSTLQTLFLAGDIWSVILPDLVGLFVIAAVFFALTAAKTRTRLE